MDKGVKNIDEFIANQPAGDQVALERLRTIINETCPTAEESISYGIASFKYNGMLVGFGSAKDHLSFYCMNLDVPKKFKDRLNEWKVSGGTIHFTADHELPHDLIEAIVLAKMNLNETKRKK